MEFIQEAIASRNVVAWVILLVLLIVFIKILKSAGKGFVMLLLFAGAIFMVCKMFPDLMAPMVDFVQGGWMGNSRSELP